MKRILCVGVIKGRKVIIKTNSNGKVDRYVQKR